MHEIHSNGSWLSRCNRKPTTNGTIHVKCSKTGTYHWQCAATPVLDTGAQPIHGQCEVPTQRQWQCCTKRERSTTGRHTNVDQIDSKERVGRRTSAGSPRPVTRAAIRTKFSRCRHQRRARWCESKATCTHVKAPDTMERTDPSPVCHTSTKIGAQCCWERSTMSSNTVARTASTGDSRSRDRAVRGSLAGALLPQTPDVNYTRTKRLAERSRARDGQRHEPSRTATNATPIHDKMA